jgi:hypothetical protein
MPASRLHALNTDVVALEAVVRALVRSQAGRSRTALTNLLDALSEESDRLGAGSPAGDPDVADVCAVLNGWIEDIKNEAMALQPASEVA